MRREMLKMLKSELIKLPEFKLEVTVERRVPNPWKWN